MSAACCVAAFGVLVLGAVRSGHEMWTLDVNKSLLVLIAFLLLFGRRVRFFSKELYTFLLVACLEVPVQWMIYDHYGIRSAVVGVLSLAMMLVLASLLLRRGNERLYWNIINGISLFASWCLIFQMTLYMTGVRLDRMPILSAFLFKGWEFSDKFRPCGPFSEPSHMAELLLLSLYYYLFIQVDLKRAIVLTAALLLSTSNLGILGSVMLVGLYVWNLDSSSRMRKIKKGIVLFAALLAAVGIYRWLIQSDNWVAERLLSGGTFVVRTMRSFELFGRFDLFEKLLGIGIQNQEIYLNYHYITLASDTLQEVRVNREFAQTLGYILCTTGLLGIICFLMPFAKRMMKGDYRNKCLVLLFLVVCFTCCVFSRHIFLVYIVMIFATEEMLSRETV